MTVINCWTYNKEQLEDFADRVKASVVRKLVYDGLLEFPAADVWCGHNTVVMKKKTVFRTLSNVFYKREKSDGHFLTVVEIHKKDGDYFKGIEEDKEAVLKLVKKEDDKDD